MLEDFIGHLPAIVVYQGKVHLSSTFEKCTQFAEEFSKRFQIDFFRIEVYVAYPGRVLPNIGGSPATIEYVAATNRSVRVGFKKNV